MTRRGIAPLLFSLALLAACSAQPGGQPTGAATGSAPAATSGGTVTLTVANSTFGDHLAGTDGHALYVLSADSANTSTCSGQCATNWPPVTVGPGQTPVAGASVTAQLGTMTRTDGSIQVTANGMPLYAFAADASATDTKGQGVQGVWYLAAPDGSALAAEGSPTPKSSDDGYGNYGNY
jgi:predicted lipoprotein with Yx(FWY)xxD motif